MVAISLLLLISLPITAMLVSVHGPDQELQLVDQKPALVSSLLNSQSTVRRQFQKQFESIDSSQLLLERNFRNNYCSNCVSVRISKNLGSSATNGRLTTPVPGRFDTVYTEHCISYSIASSFSVEEDGTLLVLGLVSAETALISDHTRPDRK